MLARNADGTSNSGGMIQYQVKLNLWINGWNSEQDFLVLNLGKKDNVILGYPWLAKNNLWFNWTSGEVKMLETPVPRHCEPGIVEQRYCYVSSSFTLKTPELSS